jgi:hypothetical protein
MKIDRAWTIPSAVGQVEKEEDPKYQRSGPE